MGIYIGSTHLVGSDNVKYGSTPQHVYLGPTHIYPENVTYVFQNIQVKYSSGSQINAAGSNYAYCIADVLSYVGSTYVSSAASQTMTLTRVSGDSAFNTSYNQTRITASTRGTTTGDSRSAYFQAKYSGNNVTAFTVTQAANRETAHNITLSWSGGTAPYSPCWSTAYDYFVIGPRIYKAWSSYTSGDQTTPYTAQTVTCAVTFTNLATWMSNVSGDPKKFHVNENTTTSDRTATITCRYSGGTDTSYTDYQLEVKQWRKAYDTWNYRISSYDISQTEWAHGASGTSQYATVSATCQYQQVHWQNGQTSTGSWTTYLSGNTTYTGTPPFAVVPQGHWKFYTYDGGTGAQTMTLYYPDQYTTYGKARVYPYSGNNTAQDLTNDLYINFGTAQTVITLTQKGDGTVSISPTSISFPYQASSATITVTTQLSGWGASASTSWLTTSVDTVNKKVTVTATQNTSTSSTRSGYVRIYQNNEVKATCTISQAKHPEPTPVVTGITKSFDVSNGWMVGTIRTGTITTPACTCGTYVICVYRADAGSNCTINFSSSGYYGTHMCGTNTQQSWSRSTIAYTAGETTTVTNEDGVAVTFFGYSVGGGPGAETSSGYAGISIS